MSWLNPFDRGSFSCRSVGLISNALNAPEKKSNVNGYERLIYLLASDIKRCLMRGLYASKHHAIKQVAEKNYTEKGHIA